MTIARTIFAEEHRQFAAAVDRFIAVEVAPHYERYEEQGRLLVAVQRALDDLKHARNR